MNIIEEGLTDIPPRDRITKIVLVRSPGNPRIQTND
jgi:hypothetical protein